MFCQNCGTELADDAVFCSKCGQQIKVQSENIEIVEPESRIKFFARLGLSTIVGVLGVVLSLIFFNETIGALVLSVLTALLITIVVMALMQKSNLRILVAIIVFVVVTFLYMDASMNILYLGGETFVQKIALFVYLCGPFTMWAMFITDKRRGPSFLVSTIKQLVIWVVLLMVLFILSNIKMNNYEERKEVAEIESEEVIEELNDDNVQEKENSEEYLEDNSLEQSVQSIYYSMTELQNGGQDVLFDNASLWAIANNWEELKSTPIAGQPVDCITYEDRIEFVYGNGLTLIWHYNEDTIDVVDTNASVDNSVVDENAEVSDDDICLAVINIHNGLSNYMNGNDAVVFDIEALRIIAQNYDKVKELDLFEAPMDVQEYDAMRSGPTVRFDYDAGVSIIWTKDTDEVEITYDEE